MMSGRTDSKTAEYLNPVYPHSFPDPFVLKFQGEYFAYCTGLDGSEGVFPVLRSRDLVRWERVGPAMNRLETDSPFYWAPEVVHSDGRFFLYYSVGNETLMELRVAESQRPDGGFTDVGRQLTTEEFAIDAHVFRDEDGTLYMFYATDFLEHTHIGTGTVIDRMLDWYTLEGNPRPVTRARFDWQVYDPQRKEKGGVRWHTVEGPTVLKRKGVYFEMFSGGNWQNTTYGVSFAVTDTLLTEDEWEQFSDGETVLPILRTLPGVIVGPGHNSVIRGPNNMELYCIYHRWTDSGRVLAIDRMDFVGRRIFILGATNTPQPGPFGPSVMGFRTGWQNDGGWEISDGMAKSIGPASLSRDVPLSFVCEFTVSCSADEQVSIRYQDGRLSVVIGEKDSTGADGAFELTPSSYLVRLQVDGRWISVLIDGWHTAFADWLEDGVTELCLDSVHADISLGGFSLTDGFEDRFDRGAVSPDMDGWTITGEGEARSGKGEMVLSSSSTLLASRPTRYVEIDFAVNLKAALSPGAACGLILTNTSGDEVLRLEIGQDLRVLIGRVDHKFDMPDSWDLGVYHQYRLMVRKGRVTIYLESNEIGSLAFAIRGVSPGVFVHHGSASVEMVRAMSI